MEKELKKNSLKAMGLHAQTQFAYCYHCRDSTEHHKPALATSFRCNKCGKSFSDQGPVTHKQTPAIVGDVSPVERSA